MLAEEFVDGCPDEIVVEALDGVDSVDEAPLAVVWFVLDSSVSV